VLIPRPGQTLENPSSHRRVFWVLSRRDLRQNVFTFPADVPENKKKALLRVQVRRWAPFANAQFVAQWSGSRASVYAWNDDEVKASITAAGFNARRCIVYPETFLRRPLQNGARLISAIDGFEGQVWQEGFLAFTRWWTRQPTQLEWGMFLRAAGTPLDPQGTAAPEPSQADFLEMPWQRQEGLSGAWMAFEEPRYAAAAAVLLLAPFIYLSVEYLTLAIANARVVNAAETLSVETQGIRKLRSEALANLDEIEDYLSLEVYPSQFEILTLALGLLQNMNVKIPEWTYDVGQLSFTMRSDREMDPTFFITAFERSGVFANVTATRTGQDGQMRMRMDVLPKPTRTASR